MNGLKNIFHGRHVHGLISYTLLAVAAVVLVVALVPIENPSTASTSDAVVSYAQQEDEAKNAGGEPVVAAMQKEAVTSAVVAKSFVRNGNEAVNRLIENYCEALVDGSEEELAKYTDSVDDIDSFYRMVFSEYIEEVTDINCYTMSGMLNSTYITAVTYNVRYKGYSTVLPGILYCYVCTDASGNLYVSNKEPGEDVSSYNDMMFKSSSIAEIVSRVAAEHDAKLDADRELAEFLAGFSQ